MWHERPHLRLSIPIAPPLNVKMSWRPLLLGQQLHIRIISGRWGLAQMLCPFWPELLQFSAFSCSCPCCNTLRLIGDAAFTSWFCINLPIECTLRTVTEFVHGGNRVVDSCSLPPPPAEQWWSESPWSTHSVGLGFLALQTTLTLAVTNSWSFSLCFRYLHNLALRRALSVVLTEIPQPAGKELNFSTEAVKLPQAWFLLCLNSSQI